MDVGKQELLYIADSNENLERLSALLATGKMQSRRPVRYHVQIRMAKVKLAIKPNGDKNEGNWATQTFLVRISYSHSGINYNNLKNELCAYHSIW